MKIILASKSNVRKQILEKHNIKPPSTPGHPINSRVDTLLKEEFDNLRAEGKPHSIFKEYNLKCLRFLTGLKLNFGIILYYFYIYR